MAMSSLIYKKAVFEDPSIPSEHYAGRGRIVAPNGFSLSVKYQCDFCSSKNIWEGIFSGHLIDIEQHFFSELKLLVAKKFVMDCLITTYSTENASFTGHIRLLESERDVDAIRAAMAWPAKWRQAS
jgi:hypothetical protein